MIRERRMKVIWPILALAFAPHTATAQASPTSARPPVGLLIGFLSEATGDDFQPDVAGTAPDSAQPAYTLVRDDTTSDHLVLHHIMTTDLADRYATLWVLVTDQRVSTRLVQHVIVPRVDGFWQLGSSTDTATLTPLHADSGLDWDRSAIEDFFWLTPLGEAPRLPMIASDDITCTDQGDSRSLTYVGPEYYADSTLSESACAHYDESQSMSVRPLDALIPAPADSTAPAASVALLGPEGVAQLARLNRAAASWESDCGENGFAARDEDWGIRRSRGHWEAVANFTGTGAGICGRYNEVRVLRRSLPPAIATPETALPVSWSAITAAVPGATDATASPDGRIIVVLAPQLATVMALESGKLRALGPPIPLSAERIVMLEWARGNGATRWNDVLSALPLLEREQ